MSLSALKPGAGQAAMEQCSCKCAQSFIQKGTYSPYHWSGAVLGTVNRTDRPLLRSLGNGGVRQAAMGVHRQWSVERNRVFWAERIAHRKAQKRKRGMF